MEILNNQWIADISIGIISGLIVYFIVNKLLAKGKDKEYLQKITTANNELLYMMRPLIVKKQIPSKIIINSIIESITRKHKINKDDLFNTFLLTNDLMREVMENAFLNSEQKIDFCNKINELKIEKKSSQSLNQDFEGIAYQKDRASSQNISILLAINTFMMIIFINFFMAIKDFSIFNNPSNNSLISISKISTIALIASLIPILTIVTMLIFKKNGGNYKKEKITY